MKNAAYNIMPDTENILKTMGEQIKMARLRRKLSATLVAERAGISRSTLWKVEGETAIRRLPSAFMPLFCTHSIIWIRIS